MSAAKKEHNITNLNSLFIDKKHQNTINRFFTNPKHNQKNLLTHTKTLLLQETDKQQFIPLQPNIEHRSIDDIVCRKYSKNTEMTCYNHSSTMGNILSHNYVTSVYHNEQVKISDNIKLCGSKKGCEEKS
jgi:hypothetical protein